MATNDTNDQGKNTTTAKAEMRPMPPEFGMLFDLFRDHDIFDEVPVDIHLPWVQIHRCSIAELYAAFGGHVDSELVVKLDQALYPIFIRTRAGDHSDGETIFIRSRLTNQVYMLKDKPSRHRPNDFTGMLMGFPPMAIIPSRFEPSLPAAFEHALAGYRFKEQMLIAISDQSGRHPLATSNGYNLQGGSYSVKSIQEGPYTSYEATIGSLEYDVEAVAMVEFDTNYVVSLFEQILIPLTKQPYPAIPVEVAATYFGQAFVMDAGSPTVTVGITNGSLVAYMETLTYFPMRNQGRNRSRSPKGKVVELDSPLFPLIERKSM